MDDIHETMEDHKQISDMLADTNAFGIDLDDVR